MGAEAVGSDTAHAGGAWVVCQAGPGAGVVRSGGSKAVSTARCLLCLCLDGDRCGQKSSRTADAIALCMGICGTPHVFLHYPSRSLHGRMRVVCVLISAWADSAAEEPESQEEVHTVSFHLGKGPRPRWDTKGAPTHPQPNQPKPTTL